MAGCQNYGRFLGTLNIMYYNGDRKRNHNFDNAPMSIIIAIIIVITFIITKFQGFQGTKVVPPKGFPSMTLIWPLYEPM